MKKILLGIVILLGSLVVAFGGAQIPGMMKQHQIQQNKVVRNYSAKAYQGWVLAYAALNEVEVTMYNTAPVFETAEELEAYKQLKYPDKYLPDLINEFGILVQKPYAGTYSLERQKTALLSYFNEQTTAVNTAINSYITTNPEKPNAYDAAVLKALNSYSDTLTTLNRATVSLSLDAVKDQSLGAYYSTFLAEDEMSAPLAYSSIAKDYLMTNIKHYRSTYLKDLNSKDMEVLELNSTTTRQVNKLLEQIIE